MISEIFRSDVKEIRLQSVEGFRKIKPEKEMTYKELAETVKLEFNKAAEEAKIDKLENNKVAEEVKIDKLENAGQIRIPRMRGEWTGKPGESEWKPDLDIVPGDANGTNPEHITWREIMEKYDFKSILFKDNLPDFSEISKGEVEIADFTDNRDSNFDQADEKLAKQWECTPEDVAQWRKENRYTWHECIDCKTMELVPTEVHGNIPHIGGISEYKSRHQSE